MFSTEDEECSGNTFGIRHSVVSNSQVELCKESGKKCESERPKKVYEKESLKGSKNGKSVEESEKEGRERTTPRRVEREESLQGS